MIDNSTIKDISISILSNARWIFGFECSMKSLTDLNAIVDNQQTLN